MQRGRARKRIADGSFFGGWNPIQKDPKKYGFSPIDGGLQDCHDGMSGKMESKVSAVKMF